MLVLTRNLAHQADETYIGKAAAKMSVISLVSEGKARTFHVDRADAYTVRDILINNVDVKTELRTDESRLYTRVGREFISHETVNHSKGEYVRNGITTNHVENYFSVFKRGMKGIYQHCSERHLGRYLAEFDFRYNN